MKNFIIAALAAVVSAVVTVACGGGATDLCQDRNVRCDAPLSCDPDDGVCKCGGRGGVVCPEGAACNADTNTCLSNRCAGVNCQNFPGTSCDVFDGVCKCGGPGGTVCAENQVCNPATKQCQAAGSCSEVACSANEVCDPNTVECKCGQATCGEGQACTVNQTTNARECVNDLCFGVQCLGNTTCDPADGRCKCNGTACAPGQVCGCAADAGTCTAAQETCQPGSACANVTCAGGTTCDPTDGECKCGGPGGPACGDDQVCSLASLQCQGGNQCGLADGGVKSCSGGTSCDPEDGLCKCGGRGGQVCASGGDAGQAEELCVQSVFSQTCRPACDPRLQNCPSGQYCYFDTTSKTPAAYCAVPSDTRVAGQGCNAPTACFTTTPTPKGLFCNGLGSFEQPGSTGFCREFCDTSVGDQSCSQIPAQKCLPIQGGPTGVGYCQPQ